MKRSLMDFRLRRLHRGLCFVTANENLKESIKELHRQLSRQRSALPSILLVRRHNLPQKKKTVGPQHNHPEATIADSVYKASKSSVR